MRDYSFHKNKKDIGSDMQLDCNDEIVFQQEAICSEFNKEYDACDLKVSDGLSVTLPIDVCHCDIRESVLVLDVL
jgi:hypothetical protein